MSDFWAVIIDLAVFIKEAFHARTKDHTETGGVTSVPLYLPPAQSPAVPSYRESGEVMDFAALGLVSTGYISKSQSLVFGRPLWSFDGVISREHYGTAIRVLGYQGRFVNVATPKGDGWILKDDVTLIKTDIWPLLTNKKIYLASDRETELVRTLINDEFFTTELYLPLCAEEFVAYRLLEKRETNTLGNERPRHAGDWRELLKGKPGVHIGLEPKTGSVMEAFGATGEPFLGYVVAVEPDSTLTLESVGRETEGEYVRETVPRSVWQAWSPVFVTVA